MLEHEREVDSVEGLAGKVALVTGGSTGIGRACAEALGRHGASVAICAIDAAEVQDAIDDMDRSGISVSGAEVDVRDPDALHDLVATTVSEHGGLDILVNSAGIQRYGSVVDTDEDTWDEVLDVNLKGAYLAARAAVPEMRRRGGGAIVNIASVQALAAQAGVVAYAASKGGLLALTRAMAVDHAAEAIRVNAVCPASVDTPMLRWAAELFGDDAEVDATVAAWGRAHPIGRVARPEEIAEVVAFLAGPGATFVTGEALTVDGGLLARLGVAAAD